MLCEGLVQARDEHISQTNIEPTVYYYVTGAPELMGNILHDKDIHVKEANFRGHKLTQNKVQRKIKRTQKNAKKYVTGS